MSANPTRVNWESPADAGPAMQEGNRVLASIGRQEGLRALLAFSDLHEQIRSRRLTSTGLSDSDLFQTERFVLDEVLQLICDRTQKLTGADGILVALAEGPEVICRATSGSLPIQRGVSLNTDSRFLRDCLQYGKILRCDDAATDARLEFDLSRQFGARSSVLVPLRGRDERVGVLQAFSNSPWSFTDQDVRCFDLFAELVLAALKPEDQDRRINWLSDVAGEILHVKPAAQTQPEPAQVAVPITALELKPAEHTVAKAISIAASREEASNAAPSEFERAEVAPANIELEKIVCAPQQAAAANETVPLAKFDSPELDLRDNGAFAQPIVIPVTAVELPDPTFPDEVDCEEAKQEVAIAAEKAPSFSFLHSLSLPGSSRPGLSVVMGLFAIAALFSAGVWYGMQVHGKPTLPRPGFVKIAEAPNPVTAPSTPAPDVLSPVNSDHLMDPAQAISQDAPLTPVPEGKLAALPKITGVRHWSSSMGSTVVIDMEDQVPYEVHRLMSPERIYFDLHDTVLTPDLDGKSMDVGDTSLTRVRVAQPVAGVTRIVLDTKDGSNFSVSMESNPYRLVVELRDTTKMAATNRLAPAPSQKTSAKTEMAMKTGATTLPAKTGKFRIVLDAGHGGWDLGTVGRQGLLEKDLVLDVTKRLGKLLQNRLGSEVVFTRTGDDYLPLDQRAGIANQAQADLFVSVHANYSNTATARGVETYYTNLFTAPGSKEVEKHTDGSFAQLAPVSLSAAGLHEKIEESRRLAASVQRSLYTTLAAKSSDIRDRGTKEASFAVLTGTTMPAILTEISFVSSPADEHNLQSEVYRQQIAEALYKGIARYEESSPRTRIAQLRPAATNR